MQTRDTFPELSDNQHRGRTVSKLSSKQRNALPAKAFAGPDRSYPIEDASHARNALARASQFATPAVKSTIRSKVAKKFPGIAQGSKDSSCGAKRKSGGKC